MEHENDKQGGVCKPDGCCGRCGEDGKCPCKEGMEEKPMGCGGNCACKN